MANDYNIKVYQNAEKLEEKFLNQLAEVMDPELGIDIVNLGLVYELHLDDEGLCKVIMTLTTPMCPLADFIEADMRFVLSEIEEIEQLDLQLTFDPPWTIERISRFGRIALGIGV